MKNTTYNLQKAVALTSARLFSNGCRAFWWNEISNFGDLLTPALLRSFGLTPIHVFPDFHRENGWTFIGSLIEMLPENYSGNIVGTGCMFDRAYRLEKARFWSVRGPLTRDRLGLSASIPLGDPGLLADRLLERPAAKTFDLGIIPHYKDKGHPWLREFTSKYKDQVSVIDPQQHPKTVVNQISRCRYIASSSLHGIIVADSLRIPNIWLALSDKVGGGRFKYDDYNHAIDFQQYRVPPDDLKCMGDIERRVDRKDAVAIIEVKKGIAALFDEIAGKLGRPKG